MSRFVTRRTTLLGLGAGAAALATPRIALAKTPEIYANTATGLAIHGIDPVAYFTEGAPVMGQEALALDWKGAPWRFASSENRDMFAADPDAYAPQYGGWCAFALAHDAIATSVPEAWSVHKGKLYLNFSLSVRDQWRTDPDGFIARADANWPAVLG